MLHLVVPGLRSGHPLHRLVLFLMRILRNRLHSALRETKGAIADVLEFPSRERMTRVGLIAHVERIDEGSFFEAGSTDLWQRFVVEVAPRIIRSRLGYWLHAPELRAVIALEPYTFAPPVRFQPRHRSVLSLFDVIDKAWLAPHLRRAGADVIISANISSVGHVPALAALPDLRWQFFGWSVPDDVPERWQRTRLDARLVTVGASGPMYTLRNWVGSHPLVSEHVRVSSYEASSVTIGRDEYFQLLADNSAVVVAFGDEDRHRIAVAKYLEVPAVGSLLIAARAPGLEELGFRDGWNCLMFDGREDFEARVRPFLEAPDGHLVIAQLGQELVRSRHTTSHRIDELLALLDAAAGDA